MKDLSQPPDVTGVTAKGNGSAGRRVFPCKNPGGVGDRLKSGNPSTSVTFHYQDLQLRD